MRGSIIKRYEGSYSLVLDLGRETDPATGRSKRKQKWITFRGNKKQAEKKLNELLGSFEGGTFVEPTKVTLIEWLRDWLEKAIKPPVCRPSTYKMFKSIIERHLAASQLALLPLQKLRTTDLERHYATLTAAPATVRLQHAVVRQALGRAVRDRLLSVNVAREVDTLPSLADATIKAREQCWTASEARRFLEAASKANAQAAAFFTLALDTGARKAELGGLTWDRVDLEAGRITIDRQLIGSTSPPVFGPTKTGRARTVVIGTSTMALLRAHKRAQAATKLKNRTTYEDFGLLFAKEEADLQTPKAKLGQPLAVDRLGRREFDRLVKAADVRRIVFHGLRHTCATLLLQAGESVRVVADRLGHKDVAMTLNTYTHALPDHQQSAAARLGTVLYGAGKIS
jgi:integrase